MRVLVGISGGVDSAVTTYLLKEAGFKVVGLYMKMHRGVNHTENLKKIEKLSKLIGFEYYVEDVSEEFEKEVFRYFVNSYEEGATPNPCAMCNKVIKFGIFMNFLEKFECEKAATGHYVRNDGEFLYEAKDKSKDQSYFLHLLNQDQLSQSLFPLGDLHKKQVREIALQNGFENAEKKDSTGICFIGERPFADFLTTFLPKQKGDIVDENGRFIKHHHGLPFYTIGQRKGLEIGGGYSDSPEPWFVADKLVESNEILAVQGDHPLLYHNTLVADSVHWIDQSPALPHKCSAKIRYRQASQECQIIKIDGDCIQVDFTEPQRAITPGQSIVFYDRDVCLGGSVIKSKSNE